MPAADEDEEDEDPLAGLDAEERARMAEFAEEMADFADEMEDSDSESDGRSSQNESEIPWDLDLSDESYQYQFRSRFRSVTEEEARKGRGFLEEAMGFFNAVVPPFELFPYHENIMPKGLETSHFADIVQAHLGVAE